MFALAQSVFVVADTLNFWAATRYNLIMGAPDPLLYLFGGQIAMFLEFGITFFATMLIFSKLIPPGIESTLQSIAITVLFFSIAFVRGLMGVFINNYFIGVQSGNIGGDGYVKLRAIALVCSCLPLTYMWYMVPTRDEVNAV